MSDAKAFFEKDLSYFRLKAMSRLINSLEQTYLQSGKSLFDFLEERLHFLKNAIDQKHAIFNDFEKKYAEALSEETHQTITLAFAKALGASPEELTKDKKAFARWFDFSAVADRCRYQISSLESELGFVIDRLSLLIVLEPTHLAKPFLLLLTEWAQTYIGNRRIKIIALESILKLLTPDTALDEEVFHYLALSEQKDVWIQCNAISILRYLNLPLFRKVAEQRLNIYYPDPDLFVRQHIVTLLDAEDLSCNASFLASALKDPNAFVRQALCPKISFLPQEIISLLLKDHTHQVRASALLHVIAQCSFEEKSARLVDMCTREFHPFVLRVCLKCIQDEFHVLSRERQEKWLRIFEPILDHLHTFSHDIPTRRRAAYTREALWCAKNPSLNNVKDSIKSILINIKPGTKSFLPLSLFNGLKEEEIGRLFALITQSDFGCELKKTRNGYTVFRGLRLKFRLWRFLYEFFHPKTEKREGIRHTIGRHFRGRIQIPSAILAEFSQTQVPGEPLYLHAEGGYRPYLPLMDHMLSIAQKGHSFSFYTSEGITTVAPPKGVLGRLRARLHITFHFASLAELRNWTDDSYWEPSHYVKKLETLNFKFQFSAYDKKIPPDPMVTRFFAGFIFSQDWENYVFNILTISKTSILGLVLFILILCLYFFWHHMRNHHILRRSRANLFMVIGGWGTRGKSSTDRLKGALLNGSGIGFFAKTTGCEAKITFAGPYQKMCEIPYYRPYGKVSIWEQAQATTLASNFQTNVMLWECMALNAEYVKIMQQQWMKSDLATLTNAYPDHEDIQGPAGYNIAETLQSFILKDRRVLTAEEEMLPYFEATAFENNATMETVGWLEEGLLTDDVLERFPYKEHPQNVALVLKMAQYFNEPTAVALKEMASEVLPDIGALKIYPETSVNARSLQFINGMSANEEYGCLTNWYRLDLDKKPPPGVWVSTLINNRIDRVSRSRAFAQLLAHDLNADRHFIVGTNINGFMGFLKKAWIEFLNNHPSSQDRLELLTTFAGKFRICSTLEDLKTRLVSMGVKEYEGDLFDPSSLKNFLERQADPNAEVLLRFHQENVQMLQEYDSLYQQLSIDSDETAFKKILTKWFMNKFILPPRDHLSGDEMISWICEHTPPHYLNKIVGIQNIKGPGLEFVYRWQLWEKCYQNGKLLLSPLPQQVVQGFRNLMDLNEFGLLSQEYLKELFPKVSSAYTEELKILQKYIKEVKKENKLKKEKKENFFIKVIKEIFDINVSYHRTNKANKIYKDLSNHRISYFRANKELSILVMLNEEN